MPETKTTLPKWIRIVSALFALMEIMVSAMIAFAPHTVLEQVDLNAKGVDYVVQMWATRQFAIGFIFAFATFKQSKPMLILAYLFFLVMFLGDCLIGILQKENSLIISALIMCSIATFMIKKINSIHSQSN